jgi:hypothetical protein
MFQVGSIEVSTVMATSGLWNNLTLSWTYDSFGNRETQTPSGQNITAPVPQAQTLSYPSQNRISNYGVNGYDAARNVLYDHGVSGQTTLHWYHVTAFDPSDAMAFRKEISSPAY